MTYRRDARARFAETDDLGREGARAALETFYRAFNDADLELLTQLWLDHPLVQMNEPLGGVVRGRDAISAVYSTLFSGGGCGSLEFTDVLEIWTPANVVFTGRERSEYVAAGEVTGMSITTTRCFSYTAVNGGWRLVHHHGSFDHPSPWAYRDTPTP